jgi:ATP synthase protein I
VSGNRQWKGNQTSVTAESNERKPLTQSERKVKKYANNTVVALELPFTIVGAVVVGGLLGYFLDHWLHTKVTFTLILGILGFVAGLREVLRRLG